MLRRRNLIAKMMTVAAIMAGLLPIMWSHGTGAEVMQRIALPMIGGMVSSTLLTLIVIPSIYAVVKEHSGAACGAGPAGRLIGSTSCVNGNSIRVTLA